MSTDAASVVQSFDPTEARRQRGIAIAAFCKITRTNEDDYLVPSQTGNGQYRVNPWPRDAFTPLCTCPDYAERGQPCKHYFAVDIVIRRESRNLKCPAHRPTEKLMDTAVAPRKTYKQDWPAYNKAQTNEKAKFQELLADLCRGLPEKPRKPGPGRKPISYADAVFAAVFKVYCTVSGRRAQTDLDTAHERGYLSRPVRYNTVFEAFDDQALTAMLRGLIARSSLPLKAIEQDFAVDSSGFTTSRFVRWFDVKYGKPMHEADWVKAHVMTGVKTNVVTAVEIGERHAGDSPQFIPLLDATALNFAIREVSADSAYLSYENVEAVGRHGGTPYIDFKSNTTAAQGGLFAKMFHTYGLNRDAYLAHYHKRSNVESTFSMIKAKFGDHLRSKTDRAMINEALCKILGHNICCLIQSTYELGIVATFWDVEPDVTPADVEPVRDSIPDEAWAWV